MTDAAFPDARCGSAFGLMRGRPASRSWPPPSVLITGRAAAPGDRGVAGLVAELEGSDPSWLPLPASVLFVVLEVLVRDTEQALGPREEETLKARGELGKCMADCGAHSLARQLVQDLLQDMQMVLGPDHTETLRTCSNLAWVTGETGDAAEDLQLYAALVEDRLRILGAEHPDTLIDRGCLGRWTAQTGNPRRALQLGQALLDDRLRVLGADHPNTLTTQDSLSVLTTSQPP